MRIAGDTIKFRYWGNKSILSLSVCQLVKTRSCTKIDWMTMSPKLVWLKLTSGYDSHSHRSTNFADQTV